jgi:hypothetical protein
MNATRVPRGSQRRRHGGARGSYVTSTLGSSRWPPASCSSGSRNPRSRSRHVAPRQWRVFERRATIGTRASFRARSDPLRLVRRTDRTPSCRDDARATARLVLHLAPARGVPFARLLHCARGVGLGICICVCVRAAVFVCPRACHFLSALAPGDRPHGGHRAGHRSAGRDLPAARRLPRRDALRSRKPRHRLRLPHAHVDDPRRVEGRRTRTRPRRYSCFTSICTTRNPAPRSTRSLCCP